MAGEEDGGRLMMHKSNIPRFALIFLTDPIRARKIRVPDEFAKEHGAQLTDTLLFDLPNGAQWQVSLVRSHGKIWLQEGWTQFARFYSLAFGHFLVFQLNPDAATSQSLFNVFVFDTTATEISYPVKQVKNEETPPSPKARGKPPLKSPQPHKKLRKRGAEASARVYKSAPISSDGEQQFQGGNQSRTPGGGKAKPWTAARRAAALARANAVFESENPFFMIILQPTYLMPGNRMNVPASFFKENFKDQRGEILLQVPNVVGRWRVEYLVAQRSYCTRAVFEAESWGSFAGANGLRVGDVCYFELVEGGTHPRMNVVIFRVPPTEIGLLTSSPHKHGHSPTTRHKHTPQLRRSTVRNEMEATAKGVGQNSSRARQGKQLDLEAESDPPGKSQFMRAAAAFEPENDSFTVVMQPSYLSPKNRLFVPFKFIEKYFKEQCGSIVLQLPDVGLWTVDYRISHQGNSKRARLQGKSWASFVKDNNVRVGDVCAFELAKVGAEYRLNVVISRAVQVLNHNYSSSSHHQQSGQMKAKPLDEPVCPRNGSFCIGESSRHGHSHSQGSAGGRNPRKERLMDDDGIEAANALTTNLPSFKVLVTSGNLSRGQLTIPMEFWKQHMLIMEATRDGELWFESKSWRVGIRRTESRGRETMVIGSGWRAFTKGNNVKAGDVCVFQLIKGEIDDTSASRRMILLSVRVIRS